MTVHTQTTPQVDLDADKTLLLVDDDTAFLRRLARAMESRGFDVDMAESVAMGLAKVKASPPAYAVVDMRLEDGNGLDLSLIHISEPTRHICLSRMPSSA